MEQNKAASGMLTEEELKARQESAMKDPEIQNILADPVMNQVLARYERKPESGDGTPKEPDDHGESEKVNQRRDRPNALRGRVQ